MSEASETETEAPEPARPLWFEMYINTLAAASVLSGILMFCITVYLCSENARHAVASQTMQIWILPKPQPAQPPTMDATNGFLRVL